MSIQWSLVIFTALTGLAGWVFAGVALSELSGKGIKARQTATIVGLALMAVGGIASVLHLAHPEHILSALGHPTSGIFVEAILTGLSIVAAVAYVIALKREMSSLALKVIAVLMALFGVLLSYMAGSSYMMESCPAWNTVLLPAGYLGTSVAAGLALFAAIEIAMGEDAKFFAGIALVGACIAVVTVAAYAFAASAFDAYAAVAGVALVAGVFAGVCCVVGMRASRPLVFLGAAVIMALVASVAYRSLMWLVYLPINDFFSMM